MFVRASRCLRFRFLNIERIKNTFLVWLDFANFITRNARVEACLVSVNACRVKWTCFRCDLSFFYAERKMRMHVYVDHTHTTFLSFLLSHLLPLTCLFSVRTEEWLGLNGPLTRMRDKTRPDASLLFSSNIAPLKRGTSVIPSNHSSLLYEVVSPFDTGESFCVFLTPSFRSNRSQFVWVCMWFWRRNQKMQELMSPTAWTVKSQPFSFSPPPSSPIKCLIWSSLSFSLIFRCPNIHSWSGAREKEKVCSCRTV